MSIEELVTIFEGVREFKVDGVRYLVEKDGPGCYNIRELVEDAWIHAGQVLANNGESAIERFLQKSEPNED